MTEEGHGPAAFLDVLSKLRGKTLTRWRTDVKLIAKTLMLPVSLFR